ncbi:hypothetical protein LG290_11945 [Halomonas sediminis]
MTNQLITLTLMQREHQRLDDQADQLRSHTLNLDDLYLLRQHWQAHLGFLRYAPPLIAALEQLIQQQENGNCPDDAYAKVIQQLSIYRQRCRQLVAGVYGRSEAYLVQGGKLHPVYSQAFQQTFEAKRSLGVIEQTALLQRLFPFDPACIHPGSKALLNGTDPPVSNHVGNL